MASIINSVRNITSDRFWLIKLFVLAIPLYLVATAPGLSKGYFSQDRIIMYLGLLCLYCGCGSFIINKNLNNLYPILPSFYNIPEIILRTIYTTLLTAVPLGAYIVCMLKVSEIPNLEWYITALTYLFVTAIFSPFILIPTTYYSLKNKISDAFRIKSLLDSAGNFIVSMLSFVFQYIITIGIVWFLFYQMCNAMLSNSNFSEALHCIFAVFSVLTIYSYASDEYGNSIINIYPQDDIYF